MEEIKELKELVYKSGLETLLKRMETIFPSFEIERLLKPTIISAKILNEERVINKIKEKYSCFEIKNLSIDIRNQFLRFQIYGACYVQQELQYCIDPNKESWSETKTEKYSFCKIVEEESPYNTYLPLADFVNSGIETEVI